MALVDFHTDTAEEALAELSRHPELHPSVRDLLARGITACAHGDVYVKADVMLGNQDYPQTRVTLSVSGAKPTHMRIKRTQRP